MTLIAAVPCGNAFAIAADSQESIGHHRRSVQKLSPVKIGSATALIAGSGHGELVDTFIAKVQRPIEGRGVSNLLEFVSFFEEQLGNFYAADVALCPDTDKSLTFFVAASFPDRQECATWLSKNITLLPVTEPELIGWDEPLYRSIIRRYCYPGMTRPQAILASLYTLVVAEETSQYINGPFSVALIHPGGIFIEPADDVQRMTQRLKDYEEQMQRVFLLSSDLSTSSAKLQEHLVEFASSVVALHEIQSETEGKRLFMAGFNSTDWPYQKIPSGLKISLRQDGIEVTQGRIEDLGYHIQWEHPPKTNEAEPETPPASDEGEPQ